MSSARVSPTGVNLKSLRTCCADYKELLFALHPHVVAWAKSVVQAFQFGGAEASDVQTDVEAFEAFETRWMKLKRDEESVRVWVSARDLCPPQSSS